MFWVNKHTARHGENMNLNLTIYLEILKMKTWHTIVGIITIILIGAFLINNANEKREAENIVAVTKFLSPAEVIKVTVHDKNMVVATYVKNGKLCEGHIVQVNTNPQFGLFGEICSSK